jgi:hypothetical protein
MANIVQPQTLVLTPVDILKLSVKNPITLGFLFGLVAMGFVLGRKSIKW